MTNTTQTPPASDEVISKAYTAFIRAAYEQYCGKPISGLPSVLEIAAFHQHAAYLQDPKKGLLDPSVQAMSTALQKHWDARAQHIASYYERLKLETDRQQLNVPSSQRRALAVSKFV